MPTSISLPDDLAAVLNTVRRPGDFYAAGTSLLPLPHLEVQGVGRIALPLLPAQADQLIAAAQRAPYGRGEDTVIDTAVRRTWQISADQVLMQGRHWQQALAGIVAQAAAGLGVAGAVVPELYKLLVYDPGSFFVSHRDTEKAPGMFATLVIALPSEHEGGELLVRHRGREVRLDLHSQDPSEVAFAAFYADCVHEVLPLTEGWRLVLVYNLLRPEAGEPLPQPPQHDAEQARIAELLRHWAAGHESAAAGDTPEKLLYVLQHAYTPAGLSFQALKGADAAAAQVLAAAAQQAGCDLHVALLTVEENGSAEEAYRPSRRGHASAAIEEAFDVIEIIDRQATLDHWSRPDGAPAGLGVFPFTDDELCPSDALEDLEPDEQYFHEATGNEGASFDRTYRRAALVLWPRHKRLAVLSRAGLSASLPYLDSLADRWVSSGAGTDSALWHEAHELAGHMLQAWPRPQHPLPNDEPGPQARMLALLARLADRPHIDAFAAGISAAGFHGKGDHEALLAALALLPVARAGELLAHLIAANAPAAPGACAGLLARASSVAAHTPHLGAAAQALADALPGNLAQPQPAELAWRRPRIDAGFVRDAITALARIAPALAEHAAEQMLAWPRTYDPDQVLVPALLDLAGLRESPAVQRLHAACVAHLRARTALALEPPGDWARAATLDCRCAHCQALNGFLADPGQRAWVLKAAEAVRAHVSASIRQHACDLDCSTERRGSPHSLVCTKNQASHDKRVAQRQQDLVHLARLA
jgi:hypothetical protein